MEFFFGSLLLGLMGLIGFCESDNTALFVHLNREIVVTFDAENGLPKSFQLIGETVEPHFEGPVHLRGEKYLEFRNHVGFFIVHTMNHQGWQAKDAWLVKIQNAPYYNKQLLERPSLVRHERFFFPDINVPILVFRQTGWVPDDKPRPVRNLRLEGTNVRVPHGKAEALGVHVEVRYHDNIGVRLFKLKSGKYMGVELA